MLWRLSIFNLPVFRRGGRMLCSWGLALSLLAGQLGPASSVQALTWTGGPERISLHTDGTQGDADSYSVSLSADGRFAVFVSDATNLVPGDTNGVPDVFVRDRDTDGDEVYDEPGAVKTVRVSVSSSGAQATSSGEPPADSSNPSISADGRFVVFQSFASNLVTGDTNNREDIFLPRPRHRQRRCVR